MLSSNISVLTDIITAPKNAFHTLKERPSVLFPLLLILVLSAAMLAYYFSTVDFPWLIEQMVIQQGGESIAEQDQMREGMSFMTPLIMAGMSIVGMGVMLGFMFVAYGVYILLISKIMDIGLGFKHGVALISWASVVTVFSIIASFVNIFLADGGRLPLEAMDPLTLDALIFNFSYENSLKSLAGSINLMHLWGYFLMVIGFSVWTKKSMLTSAIIALGPIVAIYLVFLLIAIL